MKFRRTIAVFALIGLLVVAVMVLTTPPNRKPIGSIDIAALARQGSEGVPKLIAVLKTQDSAVEKINRYFWPYIPRRFPIQIPDPNQTARNRVSAAYALGKMGAKAAPAIPALITALKDTASDVSLTAAMALRNIGMLAVPALKIASGSRDGQARAFVLAERRQICNLW